MKSKHYFEEFKKDIKEDHEKFETHLESHEVSTDRCKHKDAKIVDGVLRCTCGAAWGGPEIETLYKLLTK
jgi:hypothetical protein